MKRLNVEKLINFVTQIMFCLLVLLAYMYCFLYYSIFFYVSILERDYVSAAVVAILFVALTGFFGFALPISLKVLRKKLKGDY
ncbi:hypothetical protein [Bacillus sonorensis]|uniref:hypothetical protein n=1 Tax=Bacillus sonorensis TaxID=119858 RepID=UPI000E5436E0|nr:hypothetical protein [Bacillus sonorensis]RHJ06995.1 hypothetical protein DW143_18100 [Bacillus sonorensis]WPP37281.1 hypothetical protein SK061_03205 [Bacillus sonorensis]